MTGRRASVAARSAQAMDGGRIELDKLLLTVDDALSLMGDISLRTFQREVKRDRIQVVHLGRRVLVPYFALQAYVRRLCDEQGVDMPLAS